MFYPAIKHLISPLKSQGHFVDYFAFLAMEMNPPWRSEQPYLTKLAADPIFKNKDVPSTMRTLLMKEGARLRSLELRGGDVNISEHALVVAERKRALERNPDEDPDSRFPIFDARKSVIKRNADANRNLLRLHLKIRYLWLEVTAAEREDRQLYDYVMFLRDDTLWLRDFDLNRLIEQDAAAEVFVPSCDSRMYRMDQHEMNDHIALVSRAKAHIFGNYFGHLFSKRLDACAMRIRSVFREEGRGCNPEMLLKWVMEVEGVEVLLVDQAFLPFQRGVHVSTRWGVRQCYHKYCQSNKNCLSAFGIPLCENLAL
jgi:hypothetical protein